MSSKCFSVGKAKNYLADSRSKYSLFSCQVQETFFHTIPKSKVSSPVTCVGRSLSFKTAKAHTTTTSITSQGNLKTLIVNTELGPVGCSLEPSLLSHISPTLRGGGYWLKTEKLNILKSKRMTCYYISFIPAPTEPGIPFNVQTQNLGKWTHITRFCHPS